MLKNTRRLLRPAASLVKSGLPMYEDLTLASIPAPDSTSSSTAFYYNGRSYSATNQLYSGRATYPKYLFDRDVKAFQIFGSGTAYGGANANVYVGYTSYYSYAIANGDPGVALINSGSSGIPIASGFYTPVKGGFWRAQDMFSLQSIPGINGSGIGFYSGAHFAGGSISGGASISNVYMRIYYAW